MKTAKETFLPKNIVLRRRKNGIFAAIKDENGIEKFGLVENDWIFWYLTAMKNNKEIELFTKGNQFASNGFDPEGKVGPDQVCYGESKDFKKRTITTYLDNPAYFFFAQ